MFRLRRRELLLLGVAGLCSKFLKTAGRAGSPRLNGACPSGPPDLAALPRPTQPASPRPPAPPCRRNGWPALPNGRFYFVLNASAEGPPVGTCPPEPHFGPSGRPLRIPENGPAAPSNSSYLSLGPLRRRIFDSDKALAFHAPGGRTTSRQTRQQRCLAPALSAAAPKSCAAETCPT